VKITRSIDQGFLETLGFAAALPPLGAWAFFDMTVDVRSLVFVKIIPNDFCDACADMTSAIKRLVICKEERFACFDIEM
jgi:hypothetical protein